MRPPRKDKDEGEMMVQKLSSDSLSINGQTFTFDSVCDTDSSQAWTLSKWYSCLADFRVDSYLLLCISLQLDIFQLVGAPLVENCMAGFNSSVFAYGQVCFHLCFASFYVCYVGMLIPFLILHVLIIQSIRREVERHIPCGVQPMPCWMKIYQVINKG